MPDEWWPYLAYILVGSLIGGLTNQLALWMLFRPHREVRLLGLRLPFTPGLVPRNRGKMARQIAATVQSHLLSTDDLTRALESPAVNDALVAAINDKLRQALSTRLSDSLGRSLGIDWEVTASRVTHLLQEYLQSAVQSPSFEEKAGELIERQLAKLRTRRLGNVLGSDGQDATERLIRQLVRYWTASTELPALLEERLDDLLLDARPLAQIVGEARVEGLRAWLDAKAPGHGARLLIDRLSAKENQQWLRRLVAEFLRRQSFLARRFGPEPDRLANDIFEEFGNRLQDEETREKIRLEIRSGLDRLLAQSPRTLLGRLRAEDYLAFRRFLADLVRANVCSDGFADELADLLIDRLRRAYGVHMEDLFAGIAAGDHDRIRTGLLSLLRRISGEKTTAQEVAELIEPLVRDRLGQLRPDQILPVADYWRFSQYLTGALRQAVREHAPEILSHIDIQGIVTEKIDRFDIADLERIIRGCASRELRAITLLGFVLGGLIGALQPLLAELLEGLSG